MGLTGLEAMGIATGVCGVLDGGRPACWYLKQPLEPDTLAERMIDGIPLQNGVQRLLLRQDFACLLDSESRVRCWGRNFERVGDPPPTGPVLDLAAEQFNACAVLADGRGQCWGFKPPSPIPDGEYDRVWMSSFYACFRQKVSKQLTCVSVDPDTQAWLDRGPKLGFVELTGLGSRRHVCGVAEDARVYCWGADPGPHVDGPNSELPAADLSLYR